MSNPIDSLQENASNFFNKVAKKYPNEMKCQEGCSKCCFTNISIFQVESEKIKNWFLNLTDAEKNTLIEIWNRPNEKGACAFLYENKCTIYEVRPIICRTQGAPLFLPNENLLDFCPLNFTKENPLREDWLNLERLNSMLVLAAKHEGLEQRVSLKKLKKEIWNKIYNDCGNF